MASGKAVGLSHMKPTRRSFGCCPTAVSGQATTLLSKVMNSRRFIVTLDVQDEHSIGSNWHVERVHGRRVMSALGQKRTCAVQNVMSALPQIATAKADIAQLAKRVGPIIKRVLSGCCRRNPCERRGPPSRRKTANILLRSEEHTSELQSLRHLVCRLLLEKKKNGRV